jgi:hypothetical protein
MKKLLALVLGIGLVFSFSAPSAEASTKCPPPNKFCELPPY